MPNELGVGNAFIEAQLSADSVLLALPGGIQADFIDEPDDGEEIYPACVFACVSPGVDSLGNGAVRVMVHPLYQVSVIGKSGYGEITDPADRIDDALHGAQATMTVNGVDYDVTCLRERPLPLQARPGSGGIRYVRRGGTYRLDIQLSG